MLRPGDSAMTIIRAPRAERFTVLRRELIDDSRLSFRALGVLTYILDKPDDWHVDADQIARTHQEGRDAIRTALAELEEAGYLSRTKYRAADGTWRADSTVYDVPTTAGIQRRSSSAGNPGSITSTIASHLILHVRQSGR